MRKLLAINGGSRAIPKGLCFRMWPEVTEGDEKLILASLREDSHSFGPYACRGVS